MYSMWFGVIWLRGSCPSWLLSWLISDWYAVRTRGLMCARMLLIQRCVY